MSLKWRIALGYSVLLIVAISAMSGIIAWRFQQILEDQAEATVNGTMVSPTRRGTDRGVDVPPPPPVSVCPCHTVAGQNPRTATTAMTRRAGPMMPKSPFFMLGIDWTHREQRQE